MPSHLQGHFVRGGHIPGILLLTSQATLSKIFDDLVLIARLARDNEYRDQVVFLPL